VINELLSKNLAAAVRSLGKSAENLYELRIRIGKPIAAVDRYGTAATVYRACAEDIEYALNVASGHSVYAVSEQLLRGYISYRGGVRIGVGGEGVRAGGRLTALKNISSLNIRVPHEVKGCADTIKEIFVGGLKNILIIAPPGAGKTTLLREMTRRFSQKERSILLIDERGEVAAVSEGVSALDVGDYTDILTGVDKTLAYENVIRAMRPDMIVTDELFGGEDIKSISEIVRAGVFVMATVHARGIDELKNTSFGEVLRVFDYFVILERVGSPIFLMQNAKFRIADF
jgi:stage III sporulation protein AA